MKKRMPHALAIRFAALAFVIGCIPATSTAQDSNPLSIEDIEDTADEIEANEDRLAYLRRIADQCWAERIEFSVCLEAFEIFADELGFQEKYRAQDRIDAEIQAFADFRGDESSSQLSAPLRAVLAALVRVRVLADRGAVEEALQLMGPTMADVRTFENDNLLASALELYGSVLEKRGKDVEALASYREAIPLYRAFRGEDVTTNIFLSTAYLIDKLEGADTAADFLAEEAGFYEGYDPLAVHSMRYLEVRFAIKSSQFARAERLQRASMPDLPSPSELVGSNRAMNLYRLAVIVAAQGRSKESYALIQLATRDNRSGLERGARARALEALAGACQTFQNDLVCARMLMARAIEEMVRAFSDEGEFTADSLVALKEGQESYSKLVALNWQVSSLQ